MQVVDLVVVSALVEATWETTKMVWQNGKISIDRIGAIGVGLTIAITTNCDILKFINMESKIPYVGVVLTGLLLSRGANFTHNLIVLVKVPTKQDSIIKDLIKQQSNKK